MFSAIQMKKPIKTKDNTKGMLRRFFVGGEGHRARPEHQDHQDHQPPPHIGDDMVAEEIDVDGYRQGQAARMRWVVIELQIQLSPRLHHVTGHRRVHETRVQRHIEQFARKPIRDTTTSQSTAGF